MLYSIYLPPHYTDTEQYPVLYLLHGYGGTQNDWYVDDNLGSIADSMISLGEIPEMIIVTPRADSCMYIDNYDDNGINYEQYFFEEFIPYLESHYCMCKMRKMRAIGGLSMGGYGSLRYGIIHHEMFCYVYSLSSVIYGYHLPDLRDIVDDYSPSVLPGITLEYGDQDYFVDENRNFAEVLTSLSVTYESIERPGIHKWKFWRTCTPKILKKVGNLFSDAESASIDALEPDPIPAVIYDIQGIRHAHVHKGMNIVNGKKMIIR